MFCPECGNEIRNDEKFCGNCGCEIEQPVPATPQKTDPGHSHRDPAVPKKKKRVPVIIIAVLTAVLLLGAGIFAVSRLLDGMQIKAFSFVEEWIGNGKEETFDDEEEEEAPAKEPETVPEAERPQEDAAEPSEDRNGQTKEEILAEAAEFAEAGDYLSAMSLIRRAQKTNSEDADYQNAYDMYYEAYIAQTVGEQTGPAPEADAPGALITAQLVSDESIEPLINKALQIRQKADAKWDYDGEVPGDCVYKGYIYMEDPENSDSNKLYLVFLMNATIKDVPIEFVYWVFYDDIAFDDQGNISYAYVGSSPDDGYTVKTAFGAYYSYYGLDSYELFYDYIIDRNNTHKVVKKDMQEILITHPVSDTYK